MPPLNLTKFRVLNHNIILAIGYSRLTTKGGTMGSC